VFIATCRRRELEGLHLAQIAAQAGLAPAEVLMNLLLERSARRDGQLLAVDRERRPRCSRIRR
jgi:hypothetical protein